MLVRAQVAVVINHFLLWPGEVRDVPAGVVAQVLARRPGALVSVGETEGASAGETPTSTAEQDAQLTVPEPVTKPARRRKAAR